MATSFGGDRRRAAGKVTLVTALLLVNFCLSVKLAHLSSVREQYECQSVRCEADFDGDGIKDSILLDETVTPLPYYTSWLTVNVRGQEVFRLPFRYSDGSQRTHIAIPIEDGRATLLVADVSKIGKENRSPAGAFNWNGKTLVPRPPTAREQEILSAMMAFDNAGAGRYWLIYKILQWPAYVCCLGLLYFVLRRIKSSPLR